jgi:sortase A
VYNGNKPILTLITCWPLGTSRYRLLIFADQISPSIENATEVPEESKVKTKAEEMPKNEKTFFENIWSFLTGN